MARRAHIGLVAFAVAMLPLIASACKIADLTGNAGNPSSPQRSATGATQLAFATPPAGTVAGQAWASPVTVSALTDAGVVDTGYGATITIALSAGPAGVTPGGTLSVTAVQGLATFNDLHIDRSGSGYQFTASASGLTSATSTAFAVDPAAPALLVITAQPGDATAGTVLAPAPAVQVQDHFGNVVTNSAVSITVALSGGSGAATLSGTRTLATANGSAAFSTLSVDKAASGYRINAIANGLTSAQSGTFDISPAAAQSLVILTQPSNAKSGQVISPPSRVQVSDAFGNAIPGYATPVRVVIGRDPNLGLSSLSGTLTVTPASGIATFGDLSLSPSGSGFTLRFTSGSLPGQESATFDVSF